jgi:hypothetical protein
MKTPPPPNQAQGCGTVAYLQRHGQLPMSMQQVGLAVTTRLYGYG